MFLTLSFTSGYLIFETFNVVGILSRAIAYQNVLGAELLIFKGAKVSESNRNKLSQLMPASLYKGISKGKVASTLSISPVSFLSCLFFNNLL